MSIETELKLSIAPEHWQRLRRHALLRKYAVARGINKKLYSVYFDTPALDLSKHAMALRLRRSGRQWLQTLKGGGGVEAGLHRRNEWEMPVAGEALDLAALKAAGGKLPKGVRKQLEPVFVTDFSRTMWLLQFEGAEIELCLDSGEIRAQGRVHPISELELELRSGEPKQLFRLAQLLHDVVPLQIEHVSKAEHGYRLYRGEAAQPVKAGFPHLEPAQGTATALQAMIGACLLHVQANVPGAVIGKDEEFLHQVRVGLRRLRVVLAMAESWRADDELAALHEAVARMCVEFGRLREWDVFISETLEPICARFPEHAGTVKLRQAAEKRRAGYRRAVVRKLQSTDYPQLLLRFGAWLNGDYWRNAATALTDFAVFNLDKRSKQVAKRARHLNDSGQLHLLRIACKKLRYSAEMFGSLFDKAKVKAYTRTLSELQDIMGLLNDFAVAQRLLEGMAEPEIVALVQGWLEHERAAQMALLDGAWKRFSKRKKFW